MRLHQFLQTANKPFCAKCRWNLDRAQSDLAEKAKTIPLFVIGFVIVVSVAGTAMDKKDFVGFFLLSLVLGVVSFAYAWNYWGTKRAIESASLGTKSEPSLGRVPMPSLFLQRVLTLPRPRKVALRSTGQISIFLFVLVLIVVGVIFVTLADTALKGPFDINQLWFVLPLLAVAGIVAGFLIFESVKQRKKLSLFRDGEVAAARVVDQTVVHRGKHSYNEITYEFQLAGGTLIRKTERDRIKLIFEDMLIPVFYHALSPDNCATLCATYLRLPDAEN